MASKVFRNYIPEIFALGFKRFKPQMVTVNLTDRCNQHCIYCEIGKSIPSNSTGALSTGDLIWVIDQMQKEGIEKVSLCGGEPFLFDGIFYAVAHAGKRGIRSSVTTNGMTVHALKAKDLSILKECKTEINISIDSFDESVNSFTRGTSAALPGALKSIGVLQEMNIPVTVLTAISKYNFLNLFDMLVSAYDLGIRQMLFQPVIYYSNYPDRPAIHEKSRINVEPGSLDVLMEQLHQILAFERNHPIKTNVYRMIPWIGHYLRKAAGENGKWFFDEVLDTFYCREIYAIIDIAYDGSIQPCGLRRGSVSIKENKEQGLMALWKQATDEIRDYLESGRYYPECNGCCHHFSRNMLASMLKYPIQNSAAWREMAPLFMARAASGIRKMIFLKNNVEKV